MKSLYTISQQSETDYTGNIIPSKFYTLNCYVYNTDTHINEILWTGMNLTVDDLSMYMKRQDRDYATITPIYGEPVIIVADFIQPTTSPIS